MTTEQDNRVLSRMGARNITEEELLQITGGTCSFTENNCTFVMTQHNDIKPD